MSTLAQQQQALLAVLWDWPDEDAIINIAKYVDKTRARGLKAYQSNGHALACRALAATYPVLAQLLGEDSFAALARAFWHQQPPVRGDMAQWGEGLADFVAGSAQLADEPYLADVARVEWALHQCASAPDAVMAPDSFALLMTCDPDTLELALAPGCALVASPWPVVSIVGAHLQQQPDFDTVGRQLRAGVAQRALVWREGLRPRLRETTAEEAAFIAALLGGQALGPALDRAGALDFNAWLAQAVQTGLLLGVQ